MNETFSPTALKRVLEEEFGLRMQGSIQFELIRRTEDPERFDRMRAEYLRTLEAHGGTEARKRLYVGADFIVHLQSTHNDADIHGIAPENMVHLTACTREEVKRIQRIRTSQDYLLALRANAIADSPRLKRVFAKRRRANQSWSLTGYYSDEDFQRYKARVTPSKRAACDAVTAGYCFLAEPNGYCIASAFGKVIAVSESLRVFLFYANAFLLTAATTRIPTIDSFSCLMIAVRIVMEKETSDFDLDPRGEPPPEISAEVHAIVKDQIAFIIGHEYAHILLGHVDRTMFSVAAASTLSGDRPSYGSEILQPKHQDELDADAASILQADFTPVEIGDLLNGAAFFFLALDLCYFAMDVLGVPDARGSHPSPLLRIRTLRDRVLHKADRGSAFTGAEFDSWVERVDSLRSVIARELPRQREAMAVYGSIYLPTYRPHPLLDRLDY